MQFQRINELEDAGWRCVEHKNEDFETMPIGGSVFMMNAAEHLIRVEPDGSMKIIY